MGALAAPWTTSRRDRDIVSPSLLFCSGPGAWLAPAAAVNMVGVATSVGEIAVNERVCAITRRPGADLAKVELTHLPRVPIDPQRAEAQHGGYRAALADLGLGIIDLPALAGFPDAVFVEDGLIALPEAFVLCRPGAPSRAGEVDTLAAALPGDRPVLRLKPPATLDGGDVLRIGRELWIGLSGRS